MRALFRSQTSERRSGSALLVMADEDLMGLVDSGDAHAFEVIFDRHADVAFSLAYRMCGRRPMAEDIVQDAFMSIWRSGAGYDRSRGSVRSWVLSVVRNRAIDAFRRDAAHVGRDVGDDGIEEWIAGPDRTDVEVERRDEAQHVRGALSELPADQRRVLELAYFGGFSHSQIAEMLEIPMGTVKGRMRLGLTKMKLRLDESSEAVL
jgi:RNA polymerase sigma-70 factor, ECF subfamily